jgi:hypothetical protein
MGARNIYISVAVMAGILFPGALLLRHAGGAANVAVLILTFTVPLIVLHTLDDRERRRKRNE